MPEREEIEAVARAVSGKLNSWLYAVGLDTAERVDMASYEIAEAAIEALDRVRDARGDEAAFARRGVGEVPPILSHPECKHHRLVGCPDCTVDEGGLRSPQGEDHGPEPDALGGLPPSQPKEDQ